MRDRCERRPETTGLPGGCRDGVTRNLSSLPALLKFMSRMSKIPIGKKKERLRGGRIREIIKSQVASCDLSSFPHTILESAPTIVSARLSLPFIILREPFIPLNRTRLTYKPFRLTISTYQVLNNNSLHIRLHTYRLNRPLH